MSGQNDVMELRRACADFIDELIDAGPWRRLYAWAGWKRGQWPSQKPRPTG